jgi:hypothetical protein
MEDRFMMTIDQAGKKFREWRATRPHELSPVPVGLRRLAIMIKQRHGCRHAAAALRLSKASLWNWEQKFSATPKTKLKRLSRHDNVGGAEDHAAYPSRGKFKPPIGFVEIGATLPLSASSSVEIEWMRPDGLKMRACGLGAAELERLALSFLSGHKPRGAI